MGLVSGKTDSPVSFLSCSPFFWLNSHLVRGYSPSLLILPGLLRSDRGGLSASSPSGERKDAWGLCRWCLVFHVNQIIQPLFSTNFPTTLSVSLYISVIKLSFFVGHLLRLPFELPWIHRGWIPGISWQRNVSAFEYAIQVGHNFASKE